MAGWIIAKYATGCCRNIRRAELLGRRELMAVVSSFVSRFNREAGKTPCYGLRAAQIQESEMEAFAILGQMPSHVPAGSLLCGIASCLRRENWPSELSTRTGGGSPGMIQSPVTMRGGDARAS